MKTCLTVNDLPGEGDTLRLQVSDEFWILVCGEGSTYGVASFGPYTCWTEKHGLKGEEALEEINNLYRGI